MRRLPFLYTKWGLLIEKGGAPIFIEKQEFYVHESLYVQIIWNNHYYSLSQLY